MGFFTGYLAQGVGSLGAFTENTAAGYSRVPVTLGVLKNGNAALVNPVSSYGGATVTVTQRALYDAPTGGNLIMWWNLKNPVALVAGKADTLNAGSLNHTYPFLVYGGLGSTPMEFSANAQIGTTDTGKPVYSGSALEVMYGAIYAAANPGASILPPGGAPSPTATLARLTSSGSIPATASPMQVSIRQSAAGTYMLPSAPADGFQVTIKDAGKNFATYNATIQPGSGDTLEGASNYVMNVNGESLSLTYDATNKNWDIT